MTSPAVDATDEHTAPIDDFEAFYRAEVDKVYRALAVTLGDRDLAREATDEAMARAFARWRKVSAHDNPGGWVFRVGLNWATSWWRKVRRERPLLWDRVSSDPGSAGSHPPTDPVGVAALVALQAQPRAYRAVVVCRVLLGLSTVETAAVLGVAEGTVKSRLARALAGMREALTTEEREP